VSSRLSRRERDELRLALSHDLKTAVSVIAGYAELLLIRDDERTRQEAPQRILEAAQRLRVELDALAERFANGVAPAPEAPAVVSTILLVDDDNDLRTLLRTTFSADEFAVVEAEDGESALARAAEDPPDVVVLDWQMPGLPGAEVLARLKETTPSTRVLVLTAHADALAESGAADAFLTKPFSPRMLLDVLEQLLERPH
jgi:CheY-like chemotaxis protein